MTPDKAFILAAGYGKRLRPLTETRPKPLVEVAGRSLIDRSIDQLLAAGISDITVNSHYLGDMLAQHLTARKDVTLQLSHEETLLDTAGGIKKMLQHFGDQAFYVLSGDGLWQDNPSAPALQQLARAWDPEKMDILILLQDIRSMKLTHGVGDYHLEPEGRAIRAHDQRGGYMFTSMRINSPYVFNMVPDDQPFSYLKLLDNAQKRGRLYGIVHQGDWYHISTPEDLDSVNAFYAAQKRRA